MNCNEFETIARVLVRDQLIDAGVLQRSLTHAEACSRCSERLAEERSLLAGVYAVVAQIAADEAPASVEAALLKAFRARVDSLSPAVLPMPTHSWHSMYWRMEAVAAVILISLLGILWPQFRSSSQEPGGQTLSSAGSGQPAEVTPTREGSRISDSHAQVSAQASTKKRLRQRRIQPAPVEMVTEFFALRDEEQLDSLEDYQLMRIELPGSVLTSVGLPVDASMVSEPVIADVVLGPDGLARAIRFVR